MEDMELINLYWETLPEDERAGISRIANRLRHQFKEQYPDARFGEAGAIEFLYRLGHFLKEIDPDMGFA